MSESEYPLAGGCTCRKVRYQLQSAPLFVHCCHCRWCQRETGTAFALNAMIESDRIELSGIHPEIINTPSASGKNQQIARCPECHVAVWSHYAGGGNAISFVRVGTLDNPDSLAPDIHIYTESRVPWIKLPTETPAVDQFYDLKDYWPVASLNRIGTLRAQAGKS